MKLFINWHIFAILSLFGSSAFDAPQNIIDAKSLISPHNGLFTEVYTELEIAPTINDLSLEKPNDGAIKANLSTIADEERAALVALYSATGGPNWRTNDNWLSDQPLSDWYGVSLDQEGRVIKLNLPNNRLSGELPSEIGNLTNLTELYLYSNKLLGELPSEIGNLANLTILSLYSNNLSGQIPTEISDLTNLTTLYLDSNNFSGDLPDLSKLTKLSKLGLYNNNLTGLSDLSSLTQAQYFEVGSNALDFRDILPNIAVLSSYTSQANVVESLLITASSGTGYSWETITADDGNNAYQWFKNDEAIIGATNATYMLNYTGIADEGLYRCDVTNAGAPDLTLSRFITVVDETAIARTDYAALEAFYMAANGPNWTNNTNWLSSRPFDEWYGLSVDQNGRVSELELPENNLTGNISSDIGNLISLTKIVLRFNNLSGKIPKEITSLANLFRLDLTVNNLSDELPAEIVNLTNLIYLDLSFNNFSGLLPTDLGLLTSLRFLSLSGNNLSGIIPSDLGNLTGLTVLLLANNNFSEELPSWIGNLTNLTYLSLGNNDFSGVLLSWIGNLTLLTILDFSHNSLSGKLPIEIGNLTQLTSLDLADNNFSGEIPTEIGNLTNLLSLDLTNNNFSEEIPTEISNLTSLTALHLSSNNLSGEFPSQISDLIELRSLSLSDNNFFGELPSWISNFTHLNRADFSYNNFSGELPSEIINLTNLNSLYLHNNNFSGDLLDLSTLTNLRSLFISDNNFTGLPDFTSLSRAQYFQVQNNALDFGDILPNISVFYSYAPQGLLDTEVNEQINQNEGYTMEVSDITQGNTYQWYYNDQPISGATLSSFQITDFQVEHVGEYTCEVKNPGVPDLILNRSPVKLTINYMPTAIELDNDNIAENLAAGTLIGSLSVTDIDVEDEYIWSISGVDTDAFLLVGNQLQSNREFDFEDQSSFNITLSVSDKGQLTFQKNFIISITNVNEALVVAVEQADQTINEDAPYSYAIPANTFNDEDGDALTLTIDGLPIGLNFDGATNVISGTPPQASVGTHTITVRATDPSEATAVDSFELTISNVNDAPIVETATADQTINEDAAYSYAIPAGVFSDEDGDVLIFSVAGLPTGLSFDGDANVISGTPLQAVVGTHTISITATDLSDATVVDSFELTISNVNDAPIVETATADQTINEDAAYSYAIPANTFNDEDGDALTLTIDGLPIGLNFDGTTNVISGTPPQASVGTHTITVRATDPSEATAVDSFELTISNVNDAPIVETATADQTIDEDAAYNYAIPAGVFSDEDGDVLILSVAGLPTGLSFDGDANVISGTPLQAVVGTHTISITATDLFDASVVDSFELTISNVNDAPIVETATADQTIDEDAAYSYAIPAGVFSDEDGDVLILSVAGLPTGLSFDEDANVISGTPLQAVVGTHTISITATDLSDATVVDSFELTISNVNDAPVLVNEEPDHVTNSDVVFSLTIDTDNVTDEDGDQISISATGLPNGLSMTDGVISGAPDDGQNGDFIITLTYSDGNGGSTTDTFVLTVNLVTGIEISNEYGEVSIQPNPFIKEITIVVEKGLFGRTEFRLLPIGGSAIWTSTTNLTGETKLTLNIDKSITEGIYLLVIQPAGRPAIVRKVIKKIG
jgi:Leucine-rich repeat (LRR) protein